MRAPAWFFAVLLVALVLTPALAKTPDWVLYTHPEKLISGRFPDKPTEFDQETQSPVGAIHYKVAAFSDGIRTYLATAAVYPVMTRFSVKGALDGARDQVLANVKGKLTSEKPMKLDGFEGREVWFEAAAANDQHHARGVLRIFASASPPRAFVAGAIQMTDKPDPDRQKFLDSIHLGAKVETRP
jgi:hypothetical protein